MAGDLNRRAAPCTGWWRHAGFAALCASSLAGCGGPSGNLSHLRAWVAQGAANAAKHPPHITPIPSIPPYHPVPFTGDTGSTGSAGHPLQGANPIKPPFQSFIVVAPKAVAITGARPGNPKAPPLQRYALSSLTLAGVAKSGTGSAPGMGQWMAVFVNPKGNVHRAAVGDVVGLRGGILTSIHPSRLGVSFVDVRVPTERIAGKLVFRNIKIEQR